MSKGRGKITDTSASPRIEWLGAGDGNIERQEAAGQRELAASSQLPTEGLGEVATALGIVVHGETKGDPLFSDVTLPAEWEVAPTDHSMWSELRDAIGTVRAEVFYKAAFYDRKAFIRLVQQETP